MTRIRGAWRWKTQKSIFTLPKFARANQPRRMPTTRTATRRKRERESTSFPPSPSSSKEWVSECTGGRATPPFCRAPAAVRCPDTRGRIASCYESGPRRRDMTASETLTGARTMWELVDRRAQSSPDHPLLLAADGETLTCGQFRDRVERVAAGLHAMGITTGSVVSWQLPTQIDTVVLSIALARLGAVQNPIIHLYREREVGFALRQTGAELFVIPSSWRGTDFVALAEGALEGIETRPTVLTTDGGLPEGDPATLPAPPQGTSAAEAPIRWIYYTSGSTADPKGVQHTDQTLIAGGWGLARALDMSPDDVGSIAFPFAHIAGPDYLVTMLSMGFPAILIEA